MSCHFSFRRSTFLSTIRFAAALIAIYSVLPASSLAPLQSVYSRESNRSRLRAELSLIDRVEYQNVIDDVYWHYTVWPEANGAKPARLGRKTSAEQTSDILRKSNALKKLWGQAITGQMLQAEINRMVRDSKKPELLQELFAGLNNDAYLVAEMIARPVLVDRLARNFFGNDQRFESRDFAHWWRTAKTEFPANLEPLRFRYNLPEFQTIAAAGDTWRPMSALPVSTGTAVWTGTEMIIWGNADQ